MGQFEDSFHHFNKKSYEVIVNSNKISTLYTESEEKQSCRNLFVLYFLFFGATILFVS